MKRVHLAVFFGPPLLALFGLAASCTNGKDPAAAKPSSKYHQGKDSGTLEASVPDVDLPGLDPDAAALLDLQKEIKTIPEALQAIFTSYDIDEREANLGKANGTTPPMQAYVGDLLREVKASRARLKALAAQKNVTPRSSNLTERLKFQSQAAEMNLTTIFRNMFNSAFMTRRVQAEAEFLQLLENQIQPIMETDDDFKAEYALIHDEVAKRQARAETVKTGLTDGIGGLDDGMFEDIEPPPKPQGPTPPPDAGE